ncbi:hypothetical protein TcCL_ESM11839 [Trypanosoma cruzi]|nr:hypothetical protein TcCL_ESM11839 [Trypanosoma cruzi]
MRRPLSGEGCAVQWMTTQPLDGAMPGAVLPCRSVYLVRSPASTNWDTFSTRRCATVSPRESDGTLRSQAPLCASPPVVCFPFARAAPTLCSLLQENTSRGKKRIAASPTSRGRVSLALLRPLGTPAAGRASRHTLSPRREPHHRH